MLKTLAARAFVPVAVTVTGFVIVCCLLLYSVIKGNMTSDTIRHATNLADTVVKSTRFAMLKSDRETLSNIIRNVGAQQGVEHVRIFNKKGLIMFSSRQEEINRYVDKNSEGCINCHRGATPTTTLGTMQQARRFLNPKGEEELAITAPVYNEPECANASCHFHPAGQKVLGTLDISLSQAEFRKSLATMKWQMFIFTLMTLVLTVGGVSALLRRSVFLPLRKLSDFAEQLDARNLPDKPDALPEELDRLAGSLYNMGAELNYKKDDQAQPEQGTNRRDN